jgi:hypothetical protein
VLVSVTIGERLRRRRKEALRRYRSRAAEVQRLAKIVKPLPSTLARMARLGMEVPA